MNRTPSHKQNGARRIVFLVALALALCSAARADGFGARIVNGSWLFLAKGLGGNAAPQIMDAGQSRGNDEMQFELRSDFLIVVRGRIESLADLKFVLDTGTIHSMIDTRIAARLALPRQAGSVVNFDREVRIGWTTVPEIQIGPLMARNLRMMVGHLKQFSEFAEAVDGVIGLDLLGSARSLRIDFEKKVLQVKTLESTGSAATRNILAFVVHLRVQGQPARLILDTGLRDVVLFKDRVRQNLPGLKLTNEVVHACEGRLRGHMADLPGIRVGSSDLQASVFVIDTAPSALPLEVDGFLGIRALNVPAVEINFESSVLSLSNPKTMRTPFAERFVLDAHLPTKDVVPAH